LVQSRCPTRLIEEGRTSTIAVVDRGGLGWVVAVGASVGDAVGASVGDAVGVAGDTAARDAVPQAARALKSKRAQSDKAPRWMSNLRTVSDHTADPPDWEWVRRGPVAPRAPSPLGMPLKMFVHMLRGETI
jgi:hypothetical protein